MATTLTLPMLGQTMEEGTILKWLKNEGDAVLQGEPLYEVMTDKVNMEVEATLSGVLRKILAPPDSTVPILAPIAIIGTADEPIDALTDITEAPVKAESPVVTETAPNIVPATAVTAQPGQSKLFISPRARTVARELGVQVALLAGRGTGPGGRIVENDVRAYHQETAVKSTPLAAKMAAAEGISLREVIGTGSAGKIRSEDLRQAVRPQPELSHLGYRSVPFTGMRKRIADNVSKSIRNAPHVTLVTEVDMSEAIKLRKQVQPDFEKKHGVKLTFTDIIVKAAALALTDHPVVNSSLEGDEIRLFESANIGVAVALDDGLIVPVIQSANAKSLAQIALESKTLAEKARTSGLSADDYSGGTFTITNLGTYGIDTFNPIIVTGQTAILGVCKIGEKPVVIDGQITARPLMNLCLSFDHRVVDGAPAAAFLQDIKKLLETPILMLV